MSRKIVGILGGMGPEATVDFMTKIIRNTPAQRDQEHIRMLVDNNPQVPDRTQAIFGKGENPEPILVAMAKNLELWGAELLAIPCNTAHYYIDEIIRAVNIPVLNIIEEATKLLVQKGIENVGLLATTGTLKTKLYENRLNQLGIRIIFPSDEYQEKVMQIIYAIKAGNHLQAETLKTEVVNHVLEKGASTIILGCTELPIAFHNKDQYNVKIYDPTEILAQAVIKEALSTYK